MLPPWKWYQVDQGISRKQVHLVDPAFFSTCVLDACISMPDEWIVACDGLEVSDMSILALRAIRTNRWIPVVDFSMILLF